jgi:hypothetical protein
LYDVTVENVLDLEGTTAIADPDGYTYVVLTTRDGVVASMEGFFTP